MERYRGWAGSLRQEGEGRVEGVGGKPEES